jgi:hypothetical protein
MLLAEGLPGAEWGIVGIVVVALLTLVGWSLRQTIAIIIPDVISKHGKTVETAITTHADTVKALLSDAKESRQQFRELLGEERGACDRRHAESQAAIDRRHEENLAVIKDLVEGLKESRHGIKAMHNAFGLHAAVMEGALERLELKPREEGK